jgi:hypothetical protein
LLISSTDDNQTKGEFVDSGPTTREWLTTNLKKFPNLEALISACQKERGITRDNVVRIQKSMHMGKGRSAATQNAPARIKGAVSLSDYAEKKDLIKLVLAAIKTVLEPTRQIVSNDDFRLHFATTQDRWTRVRSRLTEYQRKMGDGKTYWGAPKHLEEAYNRENVLS